MHPDGAKSDVVARIVHHLVPAVLLAALFLAGCGGWFGASGRGDPDSLERRSADGRFSAYLRYRPNGQSTCAVEASFSNYTDGDTVTVDASRLVFVTPDGRHFHA